MQYRVLVGLVLSSLALSISAAPTPELSKGDSIIKRIPVEPVVPRAPEPEPGCKMYTCFWIYAYSMAVFTVFTAVRSRRKRDNYHFRSFVLEKVLG
ncbi:hypothetical protein DFH09DRAFT_1194649 [Mycena vulgaris]|nr:hypothetical protein DFH09DRAFT_1194649 [Mycena vulgaris]